jgi:LmbE family N-acetylglucosaminyl deacetylase
VFGCGQWLASHKGCTVATVFAGEPEAADALTEWDERSGFSDAAQALLVRRREDQLALGVLDAKPVWLGFADHQYGQAVEVGSIAEELERLLARGSPSRLIFPLGLFHSDHLLTFYAAMLVWRRHPHVEVLAYEDALYRCIPGLLQQKLMSLAQSGICATPYCAPLNAHAAMLKQTAVQHYASQLNAFGPKGVDDLVRPERLWLLQETPA